MVARGGCPPPLSLKNTVVPLTLSHAPPTPIFLCPSHKSVHPPPTHSKGVRFGPFGSISWRRQLSPAPPPIGSTTPLAPQTCGTTPLATPSVRDCGWIDPAPHLHISISHPYSVPQPPHSPSPATSAPQHHHHHWATGSGWPEPGLKPLERVSWVTVRWIARLVCNTQAGYEGWVGWVHRCAEGPNGWTWWVHWVVGRVVLGDGKSTLHDCIDSWPTSTLSFYMLLCCTTCSIVALHAPLLHSCTACSIVALRAPLLHYMLHCCTACSIIALHAPLLHYMLEQTVIS